MKKPSASSPPAKRPAKSGSSTKISEVVLRRLRKDRPMSSVTLRMPQDVIDDLRRVAPSLGFSGYQPLIRAYIGKGLRTDMARLDQGPIPRLVDCLKRRGVPQSLIEQALADTAIRD